MANEQLYLGVDGGGTRCRVRIATASGDVVGEAVGGGANTRLGMDHVFSEIIRTATRALEIGGLDASHLGRLHAGLGLAGLPLERDRRLAESFDHPFASICFATDAYTACLGAHDGANGAILIVGTGTCGQAVIDDKHLSVAGWGFEVSDVGSGARIGRAAIEIALLAHDGLALHTGLTRAVMGQFNDNPEEIVIFAETARPGDYGTFCPMVFEAEETGDQAAKNIINDAVAANVAILHRLKAFGAKRMTLMGGLAEQMAKRVPSDITDLLVPARFDAVHGAILMAKQQERVLS